jgi:Uma2 family endonuclease
MSVAIKKLTWDDIKDWPESHVRTELVDGRLMMSPVPARRHRRISQRLGRVVEPFVESRDLGEFYDGPINTVLDQHVHYEPDLCFIAKDRLRLWDPVAFHGPPDLVIEVISESNREHDTVTKFRDYARYGVREYWLADPAANEIQVWALESGQYSAVGTFRRGQRVTSRVLEGLRLDPAQVF